MRRNYGSLNLAAMEQQAAIKECVSESALPSLLMQQASLLSSSPECGGLDISCELQVDDHAVGMMHLSCSPLRSHSDGELPSLTMMPPSFFSLHQQQQAAAEAIRHTNLKMKASSFIPSPQTSSSSSIKSPCSPCQSEPDQEMPERDTNLKHMQQETTMPRSIRRPTVHRNAIQSV